jgi:CheY-like chemotaxis protein
MFLDLVMPQMDGYAVIQRLQRNELWKNIPLVVLSGKELTSEEWEKLGSYAKEYLKKTDFTQETLSTTIKQILHKA